VSSNHIKALYLYKGSRCFLEQKHYITKIQWY